VVGGQPMLGFPGEKVLYSVQLRKQADALAAKLIYLRFSSGLVVRREVGRAQRRHLVPPRHGMGSTPSAAGSASTSIYIRWDHFLIHCYFLSFLVDDFASDVPFDRVQQALNESVSARRRKNQPHDPVNRDDGDAHNGNDQFRVHQAFVVVFLVQSSFQDLTL
jgi:hypothetical protein